MPAVNTKNTCPFFVTLFSCHLGRERHRLLTFPAHARERAADGDPAVPQRQQRKRAAGRRHRGRVLLLPAGGRPRDGAQRKRYHPSAFSERGTIVAKIVPTESPANTNNSGYAR